MPAHDDSSASKLQVFLSTYVVDSIFYSALKMIDIHFWTKPSDIPSGFPVQLDTSSLSMFFPGMSDFYGPKVPVEIEYRLEKAENFTIKENDSTMGFGADLAVKFWVEYPNNTKDLAVDMVFKNLLTNFTVVIEKENQIAFNITSAALEGVELTPTDFCKEVKFDLLTKLFNLTIKELIVAFNVWAQVQTVTIPSELFGIFTLSDLTLKYHNEYLEAGLTPTFLPPKEDIEGIYEQFVPLEVEEFDYDIELDWTQEDEDNLLMEQNEDQIKFM